MYGLSARGHIPTVVLLALILLVALSGVPLPGAEAALTGKLVPGDATLFGAYVKPSSGWSKADVRNAIEGRESQLGRQFDISHQFYKWGRKFPSWKEEWDVDSGRIPLIAWDGPHTGTINQGKHDAYIRARADAVKKLGAPVFIRWFSEMDASFHSSDTGPPSRFKSAWRRVVNIFRNRGATNVVWVWCGTAYGFTTGRAQSFYPGDSFVDWTCADGYNWAPKRPGSTWTSFQDIFRDFYNWASAKGKPIMIAETGTEEGAPGRKATWVRQAAQTIKTAYRNIKAFVYFDAKRTDYSGMMFDWRMDTSPGSMQAFKEIGQDPHFQWNRLYRPDALLKGRKGSFVGGDVYNDEGNQTVKQKLRGKKKRKRRALFSLRVENDGNISDVYLVRPVTVGKRLKVKYRAGGRDVTSDLGGGTYLSPELQPSESTTITVKVRAKRRKVGKVIRLLVTSGSDRSATDLVKAKLKGGGRRRR